MSTEGVLKNHERVFVENTRRAVAGLAEQVQIESYSPQDCFEQHLKTALAQMNSDTIKEVAAARQRLKNGTYGTCTGCREQIPRARLKAVPWAERCRKCQEMWEEGE